MVDLACLLHPLLGALRLVPTKVRRQGGPESQIANIGLFLASGT